MTKEQIVAIVEEVLADYDVQVDEGAVKEIVDATTAPHERRIEALEKAVTALQTPQRVDVLSAISGKDAGASKTKAKLRVKKTK